MINGYLLKSFRFFCDFHPGTWSYSDKEVVLKKYKNPPSEILVCNKKKHIIIRVSNKVVLFRRGYRESYQIVKKIKKKLRQISKLIWKWIIQIDARILYLKSRSEYSPKILPIWFLLYSITLRNFQYDPAMLKMIWGVFVLFF